MITLHDEVGSRAQVHLDGGFVGSWTAADGTALLFSRRDMPNGKNRGGIPVCAPIFGPGESIGLNQHGFARNCLWRIDEQTISQVNLSLDNPASQVEGLPPIYAGIGMELTIALRENTLHEALVIRNIGIESAWVNPAFHPYFPIVAGDFAEQIDVNIDDRNYRLRNEELLATKKISSIHSVAELRTAQGIWTITADGLPLFALWTESPSDYVCVEPTSSGYLTDNRATELHPNGSLSVSMEIVFKNPEA